MNQIITQNYHTGGKLIMAEKENGRDFFTGDYSRFVDAIEGNRLMELDRYGGHYDRVTIEMDMATGSIYRTERSPAAERDYVTHIYLVDDRNKNPVAAVVRITRDGAEYFYTRIEGGEKKVDKLAMPRISAFMIWENNKNEGQAVGLSPVDFDPGFKQWTFVVKFDTL